MCHKGRQWYVTVPYIDLQGNVVPAELQNVDGVLEVFWAATGITEYFLWDYIVHNCSSTTLTEAAVEGKRDLCRDRFRDFKRIAATENKKHPFPLAAGFIVTHICAEDCSLVQDFIYKPREPQRL